MRTSNMALKGTNGMTLMEILIALSIMAIVAGIGIYNFKETIFGAQDSTASQLAVDLTNVYSQKVNVGMRHDSTASVTLTKNLMDVITTPPATPVGANITGTGWVNETLVTLTSGRSMSASIPSYVLPKTYVVSGSNVVYDAKYNITFTPTSTGGGTWTVAVVAMP